MKAKPIEIKVKGRYIFVILLIFACISFLLMLRPVAESVAKVVDPKGTKPGLADQIQDTAGNLFTGAVAIGLIWLAVSVVAMPVAAIAIGAIGIAFAAFTVYNLVKRQGPNDVMND